jgi:hypothetical protein
VIPAKLGIDRTDLDDPGMARENLTLQKSRRILQKEADWLEIKCQATK